MRLSNIVSTQKPSESAVLAISHVCLIASTAERFPVINELKKIHAKPSKCDRFGVGVIN